MMRGDSTVWGALRRSRGDHGGQCGPHRADAGHHGDGLPHDVRPDDRARLASAAQAGAAAALAIPLDTPALRDSVMPRSVHIIGAGLAGLATAVRLVEQGARVTLYEATNQAGGRCRSYLDPVLGITIDNGNHLLLSGNKAALGYLETIGARDRLIGPSTASFPFIDLATRERWTLRANNGRLPWWIFCLLYTSPSPRDRTRSRMPSSA